MDDVEQRRHSENPCMRYSVYVWYIPNNNKVNIVDSPKGMGTLPDPFRGGAYAIDKYQSNKGLAHKTNWETLK